MVLVNVLLYCLWVAVCVPLSTRNETFGLQYLCLLALEMRLLGCGMCASYH